MAVYRLHICDVHLIFNSDVLRGACVQNKEHGVQYRPLWNPVQKWNCFEEMLPMATGSLQLERKEESQ